MAKTNAKKTEPEKPKPNDPVSPERVCELLGLPAPYDPPKPPPSWPKYFCFWDPGRSIVELRKRCRYLWYPMDWFEKYEFAKQSDMGRWRELRLEPVAPGLAYQDQVPKLPSSDEVCSARIVVTAIVVHFLTTGNRLDVCRWRCRDQLLSGRKVMVGNSVLGIDLGSCEDGYVTPWLSLAAVTQQTVRRKK